MAVSLSLYSSTSYPDAMRMCLSDAREFLSAKAFASWIKNREMEQKVQLALVGRLDGVIKAIGALGKAIGR
ncbi:hypothetical protein ACVBEF_05815 [Glaciimonas sp. GG7]